jgi:hypothetical protein
MLDFFFISYLYKLNVFKQLVFGNNSSCFQKLVT